MKQFNLVAGSVLAAVFAISGVYAVNTIFEHTRVEQPRVLMIGSAADEQWQRTLAGARAAAEEYGVALQAEAPAPNQTVEQQSELVRKFRTSDYEGIAFSPEDAVAQYDLMNDLAALAKLVTIGKDAENSKRLCHIGFSQSAAGSKAAWMARRELTRPGEVVLLTTAASEGQNEIVRKRLAGFKEHWAADADRVPQYSIATVSISAGDQLEETLNNPKVVLIVAFDSDAAESAMTAMGTRAESERVPMIALDASETILTAIEDGRVASAVFNDAYEDGYEAIRRLAMYSHEDAAGLPTPGYGTIPRSGEIVEKSNLADVRARMAMPATAPSTPQLHLSSANVNASLLGR